MKATIVGFSQTIWNKDIFTLISCPSLTHFSSISHPFLTHLSPIQTHSFTSWPHKPASSLLKLPQAISSPSIAVLDRLQFKSCLLYSAYTRKNFEWSLCTSSSCGCSSLTMPLIQYVVKLSSCQMSSTLIAHFEWINVIVMCIFWGPS